MGARDRAGLRGYVGVADVDGTMLRITEVAAPAARGVEFTRHEVMDPDDRGVWSAPGGARIAWPLDPDRSTLSLAEIPT